MKIKKTELCCCHGTSIHYNIFDILIFAIPDARSIMALSLMKGMNIHKTWLPPSINMQLLKLK